QVTEDHPDTELFIISGADFRNKLLKAMAVLEVSKYIAKVASDVTSFLDIQYASSLAERLKNACNILDKPNFLDLPRSRLDNGEDVSSSKIREYLKNGDIDIDGLTPEIVHYIDNHDLYFH
ncbi:MAG: hypothetical protein COA45_09875, partial [Zetaproteobacteria bacterium]